VSAAAVDDRAALIAGLLDLASFLEAHPDVPVPPAWSSINTITVLPPTGDDDERRAFVDAFAAALGVEAADPDNHGHYKAIRKFGPIGYESFAISTAATTRAAARSSYADVIRLDDEPVAA
jgi:hypothetical protein